MRITKIEHFILNSGSGFPTLLKITTDNGLAGWSEYRDNQNKLGGISDTISRMTDSLIGLDPRAFGKISYDFFSLKDIYADSIHRSAVSAIELACLDIAAKAAGVPVHSLFGGSFRRKIPLCYLYRIKKENSDLNEQCAAIVNTGCKTIKAKLENVGDVVGHPSTTSLDNYYEFKTKISGIISNIRKALPPNINFALDLGSVCRPDIILRLAKTIKGWNLDCLEVDLQNWELLGLIRSSVGCPLVALEAQHSLVNYKTFLQKYVVDIAKIDVLSIGIWDSIRIASLADTYEVNISIRHGSGYLSDIINAHFCALIPNLRIMDIAIRKNTNGHEYISDLPEIQDGTLNVPNRPGWGIEINENIINSYN